MTWDSWGFGSWATVYLNKNEDDASKKTFDYNFTDKDISQEVLRFLEKTWNESFANKNLTLGDCQFSAGVIEREMGFRKVFGCFSMNSRARPHYWNETKNGTIIDLTAGQFGIENRVWVIDKDNPLYKNYIS